MRAYARVEINNAISLPLNSYILQKRKRENQREWEIVRPHSLVWDTPETSLSNMTDDLSSRVYTIT
jgi:hypothetical protein